MTDDELTTSDVLTDNTKNLCEIYDKDQEADTTPLQDNDYYTETGFTDFMESKNYEDSNHLKIFSLNIANLLSKLNSLKTFLNNLSSKGHKLDIIVISETHILENDGRISAQELSNIVPGYVFYHQGRITKKGGGVGILVNKDMNIETETYKAA